MESSERRSDGWKCFRVLVRNRRRCAQVLLEGTEEQDDELARHEQPVLTLALHPHFHRQPGQSRKRRDYHSVKATTSGLSRQWTLVCHPRLRWWWLRLPVSKRSHRDQQKSIHSATSDLGPGRKLSEGEGCTSVRSIPWIEADNTAQVVSRWQLIHLDGGVSGPHRFVLRREHQHFVVCCKGLYYFKRTYD